jgi:hypothetical protein
MNRPKYAKLSHITEFTSLAQKLGGMVARKKGVKTCGEG